MSGKNSRRTSALIVVALMVCGALGAVFGQRLTSHPPISPDETRNSVRRFASIYSVVEENYAEPVDPDKAIYHGAIPGALRTLDPHSNFFDPKQFAALGEEYRGKYYGVGMQVALRDNRVVVLTPFPDTPAYKAGIRPGDIIAAVDGKSTENLGTSEVADLLKGPRGTQVRVSMIRDGSSQPLQFTLTRDEIPEYSVDVHFMVRPGIGYIHVASFSETTDREFQHALDELGDLKGLILDLRQNPGGLLNQSVGMVDKFLDRGQVIVSQRGRSSPEETYRARHGNGGKHYPLVVLVNGGTASAAEIVAGAIQDHDRGLIVGETTFGKGLVQGMYPLSEKTGLTLTIAKYYTPSGRLIQRNYNGVSLYEYYNHTDTAPPNTGDAKLTDGGRTVFGAGGITPDVKIGPPHSDVFRDTLLQHYAFFNFAPHYLVSHTVTRDFQVTEQVLNDFRQFLSDKQIPFTPAEMAQEREWVSTQIKSELFNSVFGPEAGLRVKAENDPVVLKGMESLPKAKELAENARPIMASRSTGTTAEEP